MRLPTLILPLFASSLLAQDVAPHVHHVQLFSLHHHHYRHHISIVFPQKAKEAKIRPKRPNSRRETIKLWWRWRENNRNVVVVVVVVEEEGKQ